MKTQITSLFGPHKILWLEGSRLTQSGFLVGTQYKQVWCSDRIICVIDPSMAAPGEKTIDRKVNKQGQNPAIRIEGNKIAALFAKFKNLKVTYAAGCIEITGNELRDELKEAA